MNDTKDILEFRKEFERFLAEYRQNRIADIADTLNDKKQYKDMTAIRLELEDMLLHEDLDEKKISLKLIQYMTYVDNAINEVEDMFYEQGFKDCLMILNILRKNIFDMPIRTLLDIDLE